MTLIYKNMSRDDLVWKVANLKETNRRLRDTIACQSWMPINFYKIEHNQIIPIVWKGNVLTARCSVRKEKEKRNIVFVPINGTGAPLIPIEEVEAFMEIPKFEKKNMRRWEI